MIALILWLLLVLASPVLAATATDDFERGDSADLGAAWDTYDSAPCQILSGKVWFTTDNVRCVEGYNGLIPTDAQSAEITVAIVGMPFNNGGVFVRLQAPTAYSGYMCRMNADSAQIEVRTNGTQTAVLAPAASNPVTWADGDVMRCEANGAVITMYQNNVQVAQGTDGSNTYPSGRTGIFLTNGDITIASFTVADLGSPPAPSQRHRVVMVE